MSLISLPIEIVQIIGGCNCSTLKLVCKYFHNYVRIPCKCSKRKTEDWSMDNAAGNGHLDVVIWLHDFIYQMKSSKPQSGYRHENRNEGCSKFAT